ncbi:hypothetical protein Hanom_Chr12g01093251 [Helianthus anomalus]
MIPSLEDLHAFELKGFKLSQLALTLPKGLTLNLAVVIKKIGELVCDFYKLPRGIKLCERGMGRNLQNA